MKRRESLESKSNGNQLAPKLVCEEKNKEKMVMTIFGKGKIIFLKMDKF